MHAVLLLLFLCRLDIPEAPRSFNDGKRKHLFRQMSVSVKPAILVRIEIFLTEHSFFHSAIKKYKPCKISQDKHLKRRFYNDIIVFPPLSAVACAKNKSIIALL